MQAMRKAAAFLLSGLLALASCTQEPGQSGEAADSGSAETEKTSARVTAEGTKLMAGGKELWVNGVNTPWQNWNDFCGNMDEQAWDDTFALLKQDHINCTRIWVNCNGTGVVRLKKSGMVDYINEEHWTDLDKLFAIAEKYEIYVMPTILSFDHFKSGNPGGKYWQELLKSKEGCDSFAELYAAEFAKRYADCEYILGVDLMNEPDWVHENDECGKIGWDELSYLFGKCAAAIHENSDMLVTVGLGIVKYNSEKYEGNKIADQYLQELTGEDGAYIDFYSTHYYMWEKPWFGYPFDISPEEFGLAEEKPCLIGETSNDDEKESGMSAAEKYRAAYDNGWSGVMVWMEYRTDGSSGCDELWYRYDLTREATNAMAEYIAEQPAA